ncbi:MAG: hypothetical protein CL912_33860 [Deltaproteobacteria bacterium]|nr:hypothetical protein [Deltaproteobacteria bacterium]
MIIPSQLLVHHDQPSKPDHQTSVHFRQTQLVDHAQSIEREISARAAMSSLKRDPMGLYKLGSDGVLRSFDGPYKHNVIDAIGLSPTQIKELLDSGQWSQETEDKFRGVDGRNVTDPKALFECPEDSKPEEHTEESLKIAQAETQEKNRKLMEQIAKEEKEGVDIAAKYACGKAISDFDLSPRVAK